MIDERVRRALERRQIRFCAIGAVALAAHGWARYTADVDLLTLDPRVLDPGLWPAPLSTEIHEGDADDPLGGLVRIAVDPPHDLIVGRGFAMTHAVETAAPHSALGCPVATPPALALLKLEAGGPQDRADLLALVDASRAIDGAPWLAELDRLVECASPHAKAAWRELRSQVLEG